MAAAPDGISVVDELAKCRSVDSSPETRQVQTDLAYPDSANVDADPGRSKQDSVLTLATDRVHENDWSRQTTHPPQENSP